MALTDKLTAIGNAIRGKTGGTDLLTLDGMVTAINGISTGGGTTLPEEALNITGNCDSKFINNNWNWFINNYGSQVTTNNITNCRRLFYFSSEITTIPFQLIATQHKHTYLAVLCFMDALNLQHCLKLQLSLLVLRVFFRIVIV